MKKYVFLLLFCFSYVATFGASTEIMKRRLLTDLDFIKNSFQIKYAPLLWKKDFAGWDLDEVHREIKERVLRLSKPTVKECQIILKEFLRTTNDYHVGISFLSTEMATLPFMGFGAEGHYYVVFVDRASDPCDLDIGDEILLFNGKPIMEVIDQLREQEIGNNNHDTDQALAELSLTTRLGSSGHIVPQGDVVLTVRKKGTERKEIVKMHWSYKEEIVKDPVSDSLSLSTAVMARKSGKPDVFKEFFNKMMVASNYFNRPNPHLDNTHWLGSKKSYIPPLGRVIWENDQDALIDAYIFRITDPILLPPGKKYIQVGYIRIPHYSAGEVEAQELQELISFMDYKTEMLVIDQINNPGGSVFYMYALASMLTTIPLEAPRHRIALTQQEVAMAAMILEILEEVEEGDDQRAQELFGTTLGGYEINYHFVEACTIFCHHIIAEWNEGHLYTSPIHLYGVDQIQPHSKNRYTKPILCLINCLDFSGGDFFPAILQDNHRAILLGTRTAGAGGYVSGTSYPNLLGVQAFQMTASLAVRKNGDPLENLGVEPDIIYALTKKDLENNYNPYIRKILETLCQMSQ